jgi:hypothetical protein
MQVTVIGIYDNLDEARATEGELEDKGFSAQDINIATEREAGNEPPPHENTVLRVFRELFGLDDVRHAGAQPLGRYVLTLYADEARAQAAAEVMNRHHPVFQRVSEPLSGRDVTPEEEPIAEVEPIAPVEPKPSLRDVLGEGTYFAHFNELYGGQGKRFEAYSPAYDFGERLAQSEDYKGASWDDAHEDFKRDWEALYPTRPWDEFKGAVRYAWDKAISKAV